MNMVNVKFLETSVVLPQSIFCCNSVMMISTLLVLFIIKVSMKAIFSKRVNEYILKPQILTDFRMGVRKWWYV